MATFDDTTTILIKTLPIMTLFIIVHKNIYVCNLGFINVTSNAIISNVTRIKVL